MAIKLNWERVQRLNQELQDKGYKDTTPLIFILFTSDGTPRKTEIVFAEMMNVFWSLANSEDMRLTSLIVQSKAGTVLYRHKRINNGNEEIPNGGNIEVVSRWNDLTEAERNMYTRLMIVQIQSYDK